MLANAVIEKPGLPRCKVEKIDHVNSYYASAKAKVFFLGTPSTHQLSASVRKGFNNCF